MKTVLGHRKRRTYNTGNDSQSLGIDLDGGSYKKWKVCACVTGSLGCAVEIGTTSQINCTLIKSKTVVPNLHWWCILRVWDFGRFRWGREWLTRSRHREVQGCVGVTSQPHGDGCPGRHWDPVLGWRELWLDKLNTFSQVPIMHKIHAYCSKVKKMLKV